jgi:amino acid transporter
MDDQEIAAIAAPHLQRVLGVWDLIFYGIVCVTPIAPLFVYGLAQVMSRGHAVDTILLSMVAMVLTAISYGRMSALYPSAGSAYTYAARGINPHVGFLVGWVMILDYVINPTFTLICGGLTVQRIFPRVPYPVWVTAFAIIMTVLNLRGIRWAARTNRVLIVAMFTIIGVYIFQAVRYLTIAHGPGALVSLTPFYDPGTFDWRHIVTATSFAALTYIGFDSVTTLAEEVKNPRRNVLVAIVSVCLFTGLFGALLVYLAQLVFPQYQAFTNPETAFLDVARRAGGPFLFQAIAVLMVIALLGSALTAQIAAARLLYGMGRDNVLPRSFFGYLHPRHKTPTLNVLLVGLLSYIGALTISYEHAGETLNFGAFVAFMAVNAATFWRYYLIGDPDRPRSLLVDVLLPVSGFLFCFGIWISLPWPAKIAGGAWFLAGFLYLVLQTKGFRTQPILMEFTDI